MLSGDFVTYDGQLYYRPILDGYYVIYKVIDGHIDFTSYQMEHRFLYERHYGVRLPRDVSIHHINHDKLDNHIENLCALTRSEHAKLHAAELGKVYEQRYCVDCGVPIYGRNAVRCVECSHKNLGFNGPPPKDVLKELIKMHNNTEIAKEYGVSETAVRKWRKKYGLPSANEQHGRHRGGKYSSINDTSAA